MAKINGTLYVPYSGSDKILYSTDATLNLEQDLPDVTNKESAGWEEHINGVRRWSIDCNGFYDESGAGITIDEVIAAIIGRTADTVIAFKPTSGVTKGWQGNGTFQKTGLSAGKEDGMKASVSIKGNGELAAI